MKELEKRRGLTGKEVRELKAHIGDYYTPKEEVRRTLLIKVQNDDFTADPNELIDIKIKLIDNDSLLAVKYGSWHGDALREEHEINFNRDDLSSLINFLHLLTFGKFILVSTKRTIWQSEGLIVTLDEYQGLDRALFEIEAHNHSNESKIDEAFMQLGIAPMDSSETVEFVNSINKDGFQIQLGKVTPRNLAERMIELHTC